MVVESSSLRVFESSSLRVFEGWLAWSESLIAFAAPLYY